MDVLRRRWPEIANCYACKAEIVFDNEHIGKNGKKIPLDPFTKQPHDCPMREKRPSSTPFADAVVKDMEEGNSPWTRVEEKDDHGNESYDPIKETQRFSNILPTEDKKYVDHTAKGASKVQIFSNETKADTQAEYNEFLRLNNGKIKTQGAHDHVTKQDETEPLVYSIYLYYEETK